MAADLNGKPSARNASATGRGIRAILSHRRGPVAWLLAALVSVIGIWIAARICLCEIREPIFAAQESLVISVPQPNVGIKPTASYVSIYYGVTKVGIHRIGLGRDGMVGIREYQTTFWL